ncbi:unnamed protein product [Xylocopa violacea]|uniref:Uncharacterized protein n=1 Tax=Xylocopa violacea TaxID=135666 RepID=A0ABP1N5B7_XYLVO
MRQIFCLFLITCVQFLLADERNNAYCFTYTWSEPVYNDTSDFNCTTWKGIPCVEPVITSDKPPNATELWESKNTTFYYPAPHSSVCIKYTYMFHNQIVNTTSFFGKVVEEGLGPITTGCYEQYVDGYVLKMCACLPIKGREPCNAAVNVKYSITLVIMLSFFISVKFT